MVYSRVSVGVAIAGAALLAWGCSSSQNNFVAKPEPWRADEEQACLNSGMIRESSFVQSRSALGGPSEYCGAARPFEMSAAAQGRVSMKPAAMLRCPMVPAVERWVQMVVEPAARAHLGTAIVEVKVAASYACRPINHVSGGKLSEHGHANALDVSQFHLADGRVVTVKGGWYGDARERNFLRAVHDGACREFTTVLGPEHDAMHRDHFHLDLARHGRDGQGRICK
jgi:hypothetical protein